MLYCLHELTPVQKVWEHKQGNKDVFVCCKDDETS
jgi:hypothetical protein